MVRSELYRLIGLMQQLAPDPDLVHRARPPRLRRARRRPTGSRPATRARRRLLERPARAALHRARAARRGRARDERREDGGRRRKLYAITDAGREALDAWLQEPSTPPAELRAPALLKLFFGADPAVAPAQLDQHRARLARYEQIRANLAGRPGPRGRCSRSTPASRTSARGSPTGSRWPDRPTARRDGAGGHRRPRPAERSNPPAQTRVAPSRRSRVGSARPPVRCSAVRLIVARCEVTYTGRLTAVLPEALRLVMVKSDGGGDGPRRHRRLQAPELDDAADGHRGGRRAHRRAQARRGDGGPAGHPHRRGRSATSPTTWARPRRSRRTASSATCRRRWPPRPASAARASASSGASGRPTSGRSTSCAATRTTAGSRSRSSASATIDAVEQLTRYLERIRLDPAMGALPRRARRPADQAAGARARRGARAGLRRGRPRGRARRARAGPHAVRRGLGPRAAGAARRAGAASALSARGRAPGRTAPRSPGP